MRVLRTFHHTAGESKIRLNRSTSRTTQEGLPKRITEGNYFYFLYRSNCTCACFEKYVPSVEKVPYKARLGTLYEFRSSENVKRIHIFYGDNVELPQ